MIALIFRTYFEVQLSVKSEDKRRKKSMTTRQEALSFGMTFKDVYQDTPFHDPNWILVRYKKNKKAFLWTYEYEGQMRINIKVDPQWRDFWREAYAAVIPGYHQNKEHLEYRYSGWKHTG